MPDAGLTHVAITVTDLDRSIAFYRRHAAMEPVHQRDGIAWISDRSRPFVIVLARAERVDRPLGPFAHLGVACATRAAFDEGVERARRDGCLRAGPHESDGPAGSWAFLDDPDGNTLELSFGQEVGLAVEQGG